MVNTNKILRIATKYEKLSKLAAPAKPKIMVEPILSQIKIPNIAELAGSRMLGKKPIAPLDTAHLQGKPINFEVNPQGIYRSQSNPVLRGGRGTAEIKLLNDELVDISNPLNPKAKPIELEYQYKGQNKKITLNPGESYNIDYTGENGLYPQEAIAIHEQLNKLMDDFLEHHQDKFTFDPEQVRKFFDKDGKYRAGEPGVPPLEEVQKALREGRKGSRIGSAQEALNQARMEDALKVGGIVEQVSDFMTSLKINAQTYAIKHKITTAGVTGAVVLGVAYSLYQAFSGNDIEVADSSESSTAKVARDVAEQVNNNKISIPGADVAISQIEITNSSLRNYSILSDSLRDKQSLNAYMMANEHLSELIKELSNPFNPTDMSGAGSKIFTAKLLLSQLEAHLPRLQALGAALSQIDPKSAVEVKKLTSILSIYKGYISALKTPQISG